MCGEVHALARAHSLKAFVFLLSELVMNVRAEFLCPLSANKHQIEFLEFTISDYATKNIIFMVRNIRSVAVFILSALHTPYPRKVPCMPFYANVFKHIDSVSCILSAVQEKQPRGRC